MNLTFQILDGGQPYLVPLAGTSGTIGHADDCVIRLTEEGVEAEHARFEPLQDGSIRLVDLGHGEPVVVNGEEVMQWRLQVGDRIEIGRAVLVVGQQVERPATADDVLKRGRSESSHYVRPRPLSERGRSRPQRNPASIYIPIAGALLIAAVIYLISGSGDPTFERPRWAPRLESSIRSGDIAAATDRIDNLGKKWAGDDPARKSWLDEQRDRVAELERLRESFVDDIRDRIGESRREQQDRIEQSVAGLSKDDPRAIMARVVLSDLASIRDKIRRSGAARGAANTPGIAQAEVRDERVADEGPGAGTTDYTPTFGGTGSTGGVVPSAAPGDPAVITEVRYALRSHDYALAETMLVQAMSELGEDAGATSTRQRLDQELAAVRASAMNRAGELLERGREVRDTGLDRIRLERIETALEELRLGVGRLTAAARTDELDTVVGDLERRRKVARALERADDPAFAMAAARDLVRQGAFDAAAEAYEALGKRFADSDPLHSDEAFGRKVDVGHIAELWRHVSTREEPLRLAGADGEERVLPAAGPVALFEIAPRAWVELSKRERMPPLARIGAGLLAYAGGDPGTGDTLLRDAEKAQRDLESQVQAALARARGESVGEGYRFVDGKYISQREFRLAQRVKELERGLATVLRSPADKRDAKLERLIGDDDDAVDVLVLALRNRAEALATELAEDDFREDLDRLGDQHTQLLAARHHALELIFDEVKYFYPYRPPAVSGDKANEYRLVQQEVDRRVEVVRALYEDTKGALAVPKSLRSNVERYDWIIESLAGFGEVVPGLAEKTAWVRRLPVGGKVTLQNFAPDAVTAENLKRAAKIRAFNQSVFDQLSDTEVAVVTLTNDYRVLMGRMPYAVHEKLMDAARGHAQEMAELGYFSHFSPTQGRRSPNDRMRLEGYNAGIGENLARHSTAESAVMGWRRSSGHHRNLLHRVCTEIGVAQTGRLWAQNFGGGRDFEGAEAFQNALQEGR